MFNFRLIFLLFFGMYAPRLLAQTDAYAGTWYMEYQPTNDLSPIKLELHIAASERNVLYPAHLKITCDPFHADYELLLVKKNSRELGISRNKYPLTEQPFGLGKSTFLLNGTFDLSKDLKGEPTLTAMRIQSKQPGVLIADTMDLDTTLKKNALQLNSFLKDGLIVFKKISTKTMSDKQRDSILSPVLSKTYFGLSDTIYLPKRDGTLHLSSDKKKGGDVVSVTLNGQIIIDMLELSKKHHEEEILLSPGMNLLVLFADNFGGSLPNNGKLYLSFGNKKVKLDFNRKADSAATFIAFKLFCEPDDSKDKYFPDYINTSEEKPLSKNEKIIGNIISTSRQLTFAIWDDAVEDGDSISINNDGTWIMRGCPVKKQPQFIEVTLKPGPNTISFIADNLGSIPPNTSVLEIIDGKRRKSFLMESKLGEKSIVKIFYDTKVGL